MSTPAATRRVFVHVGTPKSGTSHIQASMLANQDALARHGLLYPSTFPGEMFWTALEARGIARRWGHTDEEVRGTWDRMSDRIRQHPGTSLVSCEILAAATPDQVRWFLDRLHGIDVHIVVTARNMVRQFPATWQQGLKHGSRSTFAEHQQHVRNPQRRDARTRNFWGLQDVPGVLDRWGAGLPTDRIHVVVCPPTASDPGLLWRRFCSVLDLDPDLFPPATDSANVSLGITQLDLLRRVNLNLQERRDSFDHRRARRRLVEQVLRRYSSPRPSTPPDLVPPFQKLNRSWVAAIEKRGYQVVGELSELVPDDGVEAGPDPDAVPADDTLDLAVSSIIDLLAENDRLRERQSRIPRMRRRARRWIARRGR